MLESSSVLHQFVLETLRDSSTPQLKYAIELIYFRMDEDEVFEYLEGQATALMSLSDAAKLRELPMHVQILLTRAKNQAAKEAAFAALPHGTAFYQLLQAMPAAALKLRPLYVQAFKGLEIDNPDSFFPTAEEIEQQIQAQSQQKSSAPGKISESMNYKDAPPDIRRQMEALAGFTPSTMQEPDAKGANHASSTTASPGGGTPLADGRHPFDESAQNANEEGAS